MENSTVFNKWKADVENVHIISSIDCLRIIELNLTNNCNLKCPFCPLSVFNMDKLNMPLDIVFELKKQLAELKYDGYICVAGHGEPTLHPNILTILNELSCFKLVLVTNGTQFNNYIWKKISELCQIKVSVHDWSNFKMYQERFLGTNAIFRNHDMKNPLMNIYNRAGILKDIKNENACNVCNYPFYKTMIDVDGRYMICEADWTSTTKSSYDIFECSIKVHFCNRLNEVRTKMLSKDCRKSIECCKECNIHGSLIGNKFRHYFEEN